MRLSLLTLAGSCFALPSSSSTSSPLTANNSPDRWVHYDLTKPFNSTLFEGGEGGALEKRRQIGVCEATGFVSSCVVSGNGVGGWMTGLVNYVGNLIYDQAHSGFACDPITGGYKELSFRFQARGGDCSTTAQRKTIKGAIENHLQSVDEGRVCSTECLKLDHEGSWHGYLLVGPAKSFDSSRYCGPDLDFSGCSSGGGKDFGK